MLVHIINLKKNHLSFVKVLNIFSILFNFFKEAYNFIPNISPRYSTFHFIL